MRRIFPKTFVLALFFLALPMCAAEEKPVPDFRLINQEGKSFQLYDLKGNYIFVSFIFSRCPMPKMCPLTMTLSNQVAKQSLQRKKATLKVLAVTLDPQYDTPAVLKKLGKTYSVDFKQFTLATGPSETINDFSSRFNVIGVPNGGSMSHNVKSALLDPQMKIVKEFKDNAWSAEEVLKLIP